MRINKIVLNGKFVFTYAKKIAITYWRTLLQDITEYSLRCKILIVKLGGGTNFGLQSNI